MLAILLSERVTTFKLVKSSRPSPNVSAIVEAMEEKASELRLDGIKAKGSEPYIARCIKAILMDLPSA
jgi:hypothetical protein